MENVWTDLGDILASDLAATRPALAARVRRLIGSAEFDSVQLWRNESTQRTVPFFLFSEAQLKALLAERDGMKEDTPALANCQQPSKDAGTTSIPGNDVHGAFITYSEQSGLQKKLESRLAVVVPGFAGAATTRLTRTRVQNSHAAKWYFAVRPRNESAAFIVKSQIPARDLVKSTEKVVVLSANEKEIWIGYEPAIDALLVTLKSS